MSDLSDFAKGFLSAVAVVAVLWIALALMAKPSIFTIEDKVAGYCLNHTLDGSIDDFDRCVRQLLDHFTSRGTPG